MFKPKPQFRGRATMLAALSAILASGLGRESWSYKAALRRGFRRGKHNGRQPGAFGGPSRAKRHRSLYVSAA